MQMQGVGVDNEGIFFLGVSNIPWGLDSAISRRIDKCSYVPLPEEIPRRHLFELNIGNTPCDPRTKQACQGHRRLLGGRYQHRCARSPDDAHT